MSELTGTQKASAIDALLSGYTSDEQLAELLALRLDVNLAEIAKDAPLREQVFELITWAEAQGRTKELLLQAQAFRPGNAKLTSLVDALYPGERLRPADQSSAEDARGHDSGRRESARSESAGGGTLNPGRGRALIVAAVAVAALLIVAVAMVWRVGGGRNGGGGGNGGGAGKDRPPRPPATMRLTTVTAFATGQTPPRVVVDARFPAPQLSPGSVLYFAVGSGPRCGKPFKRAQVDQPSLGLMTFVLAAEREQITCAQLFVEDANGQTVARSDPQDISYQAR